MKAIVINQYPFHFYGLLIIAYQTEENKLIVPVRHMCEILGLGWQDELRLIRRNPLLRESVYIVLVPVLLKSGRAKDRNLACMAIEFLPYWMSILNVAGMKAGVRKKIAHYQLTVRDALWLAQCKEMLPETLVPYVKEIDADSQKA